MKFRCFTLAVVLLFGLTVSGQQPSMRFDRVQLLEETSETSANVSLGDLYGDGHLDLMLAKGRHWLLVDQVLLNDGKGNIPAIYVQRPDGKFGGRLPLGNHTAAPYALAVADLNRDAKVDIIVGNVEARSVVYFNDNGRTFHSLEFGDNKGTAYGIATGCR